MTKENTISEQEAIEAVHAFLTAKGIDITKTLVNQVIDAQIDLAVAGLTAGKGIKLQGLGTIEVRTHGATTRTVPTTQNEDGSWNFKTVEVPAGKHIGIATSEKLAEAMNAEVQIEVPVS